MNSKEEYKGLSDPKIDRDSCGIGFVATTRREKSHKIVQQGLEILINLSHRGACGCDPDTGDGGGMLLQIPHEFFSKIVNWTLPPAGSYGVGMIFFPKDKSYRESYRKIVNSVIEGENSKLLGWRVVPTVPEHCGQLAREVMPDIEQVFIAPAGMKTPLSAPDQDIFERKLFIICKQIERQVRESGLKDNADFYICSMSSRTIVYKGQLIAHQIPKFFPDLTDPDVKSALAMVHQRFSTNTFPSWKRAHPYRAIIHNGEINTLRGNINWMRARESLLSSPLFGKDLKKILPVIDADGSDSAMFDNVLEFLVHTGRSMPHAVMMMIPEAWQKNDEMDQVKEAFYEYHACFMEPWDGPASIAFTDGRAIGAVLDRNGLRPSRYVVTKDGLVVLASEVGVLDIPDSQIDFKGRLQPGRMFLVDTEKGKVISDEELKSEIASKKPYRKWLQENLVNFESLPKPKNLPSRIEDENLLAQQKKFGYTHEDLKILLSPMALNGQEAVGSMGIDTPLAVLSNRPQTLCNYFKQLFAQVTNPPIDPLREDMVMSVETSIGSEQNLFEETPEHCHQLRLDSPSLSDEQLAQIKEIKSGRLKSCTLPMFFKGSDGDKGLEKAIETLRKSAAKAVNEGAQILILSDRPTQDLDETVSVPIPCLLAVASVHHYLIKEGLRMKTGIVVESGEPREIMHFALLSGYGAGAWHPYLAYDSIRKLVREGVIAHETEEEALTQYRKAIDKGVMKVATKMGISTLQSYRGAQIFEAIGLNRDVIDKYFTWTASRIEGIGLGVIAQEAVLRHKNFLLCGSNTDGELELGGMFQWRRRGEYHLLNPDTIGKLQHAVRASSPKSYEEYSQMINDQSKKLLTLRGLLQFKSQGTIPLDQVEPAKEIVKRFATGAMSLGSISRETHETLAIAMNRIGGKSNTGEGGEDPERYFPDPNGDSRRSSIKQVASGRFGVTISYLANSDDLQIKIAQGAKPGEGGQLPGHKVSDYIAKVRYSVPGVGLISPPPHHDIYSIEDIAQLIHDLKNSNPQARIHVKLVSEVGVGTVAAGVAKAKADVVLISGYEGGTGASPLSSIQHAGAPWEMGLAETQQVLVENGLRGRIVVQTDGKMQTGRDVAVAALLGAEEYGFSTAPLVSLGCIMMRVCHLNTCPVGIATQDPVLRKKFEGKPEHVINYFFFVAEELRKIMAQIGFRTMNDMIGRVDMLDARDVHDHWKAKGLDLSHLLYKPEKKNKWYALHCIEKQDHGLDKALDNRLIDLCKDTVKNKKSIKIDLPIKNSNRCVGTMLSGFIAKTLPVNETLPDDTIQCNFKGTAGQSFGAFLAAGVTLTLEGDSNDYTGKGLSGGRIIVYPPKDATYKAEENIVIGNVALYGATEGEAFFRGVAGERFSVRNSGALAVVEGVGDHGCEYMTKGTVVVLGKTGRNFAAGMSGGIAYVYDNNGGFKRNCNMGMVEIITSLTAGDQEQLREIIRRHFKYTGSQVGDRILNDWQNESKKFVKVLPVEYKKVLAKMHLDKEAMRLASI